MYSTFSGLFGHRFSTGIIGVELEFNDPEKGRQRGTVKACHFKDGGDEGPFEAGMWVLLLVMQDGSFRSVAVGVGVYPVVPATADEQPEGTDAADQAKEETR